MVGYRLALPEERLDARFSDDSALELTPELIGPSITRNEGLVGEGVTLTPEYLRETRAQTIAYHLAQHLLDRYFRDPSEPPKNNLFLQLRDITRRWLDEGYLRCEGNTYPAQVLYREVANRAIERIYAAITDAARLDSEATPPVVKAILDPYNPTGSTRHVNFTTSKQLRWQTREDKSHVNWAICDSEWEGEFCRVAEDDPRVLAYVKNQGLNLGVPYYLGETEKTYVPDFIVLLDDGGGWDDPLRVVVETKGYRREDDIDKANAIRSFWVPGVNALCRYGRWAFVELKDPFEMQTALPILAEAGESGMKQVSERTAARRLALAGGSDPNMEYIPATGTRLVDDPRRYVRLDRSSAQPRVSAHRAVGGGKRPHAPDGDWRTRLRELA